jgi:hypothetical protein
LLIAAEPRGEKPVSDEEQLHRVHEELGAAWSRGGAEAAARLWAEDGARVGGAGEVQRGRDEIAAALDVMKKVDGEWLMLESHPKLFPLAPAAPKAP